MYKNKIKLTVILFLYIFLLVNSVSALEVLINIKDTFYENETMQFNYTIISNEDTEISFYPQIHCPNAPIIQNEPILISLKKKESFIGNYTDFKITSLIEPQDCTALIQITEPFEITTIKQFSIDINPSFSFNIKLDKKVFVLNEDIYLDYTSEIPEPTITAILTYPDKTTKQLTLPTSIKATQIGTYTLDIIASKEGYKTITKKEQFGVIEKEAEFKSTGEIKESKNYTPYILLGLAVIALIAIIIYFKKQIQQPS